MTAAGRIQPSIRRVVGVRSARNEIAILDEVDVSAEADVIHETVQRLTTSLHRDDLLRLRHDLLRQRVLHNIPRDHDAVLRISSPSIEELLGHAGLEHSGGCKYNGRTAIVEGIVVDALQIAYV